MKYTLIVKIEVRGMFSVATMEFNSLKAAEEARATLMEQWSIPAYDILIISKG